jgi:hypothetical protein
MAYREVTVIEVREVLRQWLMGVAKARIALNTRADRKTVRRCVTTAEREGLSVEQGPDALTDELVARILSGLRGNETANTATPGRVARRRRTSSRSC